jgi:glycosyltransferase involved in cell wall biosynthesis
MVPYKRIDLIVEAFASMPERKLVVIGDGPEMARVRALAADAPNVTLLGYQPFDVLRDHMQRARAFVFAAEEDFGIAPLEAQACGTPVIAYGKGGVLDTIRAGGPKPTGMFFDEQSVASMVGAVERFETAQALDATRISATDCRAQAERFAPPLFRAAFKAFVGEKLASRRMQLERSTHRGLREADSLLEPASVPDAVS